MTSQDTHALYTLGITLHRKPLLAERLPIERFPEALKLAGSGDALKVQIQP